jgi:hypothetical protein
MSQSSSSQRKPEKVFRIGFVSASVFAHNVETDDGTRTIRSVSIQKRYKDGDEVKYTSSFNGGLSRAAGHFTIEKCRVSLSTP